MMDLSIFVDPLALGIVGGGTLLATAARGPLTDAVTAVHALKILFRAPFEVGTVRSELARAERVAAARDLQALEAVPIADRDVRLGVEAVADNLAPDQIEALLDQAREARVERHRINEEFWAAAAEAAPAMGMVGTLVGLVRMFRSMDDPASIGSAMAVALLATLYGALFANLVLAPISARLRRLARAEEMERRKLVQPFRAFAARVTPRKPGLAA